MKLTFQKQELQNAISIVMKAVPTRSSMNILECILLEGGKDGIFLTANDMEIAIRTKVEGEIREPGIIAINARLFSDIVRSLPDDGEIYLSEESENIAIRCEQANFHIVGRRGDDFPGLPEFPKNEYLCLSRFTLKEIINQTIFSISTEETVSPQMSGELFEIRNNKLRVVSLDGHRISLRRIDLKEKFPDRKVIVPGKALQEVSRILPPDAEEDVFLYFSDNYILFEFADTVVLSRLIEGDYYRIDQMISGDFETKVVLERKSFLNAIERSTLLAKETDKKPIILDIHEKDMELSMTSMLGSMHETLPVRRSGSDQMIGFNPRFLIDVLKVLNEDEVTLYLVNAKAPMFIRDEEDSYIYLILPVNFSNPS